MEKYPTKVNYLRPYKWTSKMRTLWALMDHTGLNPTPPLSWDQLSGSSAIICHQDQHEAWAITTSSRLCHYLLSNVDAFGVSTLQSERGILILASFSHLPFQCFASAWKWTLDPSTACLYVCLVCLYIFIFKIHYSKLVWIPSFSNLWSSCCFTWLNHLPVLNRLIINCC